MSISTRCCGACCGATRPHLCRRSPAAPRWRTAARRAAAAGGAAAGVAAVEPDARRHDDGRPALPAPPLSATAPETRMRTVVGQRARRERADGHLVTRRLLASRGRPGLAASSMAAAGSSGRTRPRTQPPLQAGRQAGRGARIMLACVKCLQFRLSPRSEQVPPAVALKGQAVDATSPLQVYSAGRAASHALRRSPRARLVCAKPGSAAGSSASSMRPRNAMRHRWKSQCVTEARRQAASTRPSSEASVCGRCALTCSTRAATCGGDEERTAAATNAPQHPAAAAASTVQQRQPWRQLSAGWSSCGSVWLQTSFAAAHAAHTPYTPERLRAARAPRRARTLGRGSRRQHRQRLQGTWQLRDGPPPQAQTTAWQASAPAGGAHGHHNTTATHRPTVKARGQRCKACVRSGVPHVAPPAVSQLLSRAPRQLLVATHERVGPVRQPRGA
jgi:hypothetical protein